MTKPKQPPKNFFRYLVDEYILFRRDFVIETAATVEDCVSQLSQLSHEKSGCLYRQRISTSVVQSQMSTTQNFVIKSEEKSRTGYAKIAHAEGYIEQMADGTSLISGKVLMSSWQFWLIFMYFGFIVLLPVVLNVKGEPDSQWLPNTPKEWFTYGLAIIVFIYL